MIWRVRDRATFAAFGRARRWRRGPLTLRYVPADDGHPPRVAYAVHRSVGTAVRRARAKRRLRAAVAQLEGRLAPGAYLLGAGSEVVTMEFADLIATIEGLVADAGARR